MFVNNQFKLGEYISTVLDRSSKFMVSSIQINIDNSILYGCVDDKNILYWFRPGELKCYKSPRRMGFN